MCIYLKCCFNWIVIPLSNTFSPALSTLVWMLIYKIRTKYFFWVFSWDQLLTTVSDVKLMLVVNKKQDDYYFFFLSLSLSLSLSPPPTLLLPLSLTLYFSFSHSPTLSLSSSTLSPSCITLSLILGGLPLLSCCIKTRKLGCLYEASNLCQYLKCLFLSKYLF